MNNGISIFCDGIPYPEGPVFDRDGNLFVCARRSGLIMRYSAGGTLSRFAYTGGKPNGLTIAADGRLLVADATRRQILACTPNGKLTTYIGREAGRFTLIGPNDLCLDSHGHMYFTDPGLDMSNPCGAIYRWISPTSTLELLTHHLMFPNGLAVTPGGDRLYFVETPTGRLRVIELDKAGTYRLTTVVELGHDAHPDGMAWLDAGHLLIALHGWGGLAIVRINDGDTARFKLEEGCHPTNVVLHQNTVYVTEDSHGVVLSLPRERLLEQVNMGSQAERHNIITLKS